MSETESPLTHIQKCLESGPSHSSVAQTKEVAAGLRSLPDMLKLYCGRCDAVLIWRRHYKQGLPGYRVTAASVSFDDRQPYSEAEYYCSNCQSAFIRFWFSWPRGEAGAIFQKLGEDPPLRPRISATLAKRLTGETRSQYLKALEEFNEGKYLGAVSYLRRVVDDKMNEFLDGLAALAREEHVPEEDLKKLGNMKKARFSDKAEYAKLITPPALQVGGVNPIGFLFQLSSDGLHNRTEEECREVFQACRGVFEEVFERVAVREDRAKKYAESISAMHSANNPQKKKK